jgi:hypothetical protein
MTRARQAVGAVVGDLGPAWVEREILRWAVYVAQHGREMTARVRMFLAAKRIEAGDPCPPVEADPESDHGRRLAEIERSESAAAALRDPNRCRFCLFPTPDHAPECPDYSGAYDLPPAQPRPAEDPAVSQARRSARRIRAPRPSARLFSAIRKAKDSANAA